MTGETMECADVGCSGTSTAWAADASATIVTVGRDAGFCNFAATCNAYVHPHSDPESSDTALCDAAQLTDMINHK